jgi:hypothetical protein
MLCQVEETTRPEFKMESHDWLKELFQLPDDRSENPITQ